jgi:uncharacterized membrane protein
MAFKLDAPGAGAMAAPPHAMARDLPVAARPARPRLDAIDFLRGLVIVVMVLDHARDFLGGSALNPRDVHEPALFLTRWITHFCAPVFVFLAGVSAFLYASRGRTPREVSWFLLTRGLWLILIEVTLVRLGWTFNLSYDFVIFQVIWAIGAAMVTLSGLIFLPRWAIAAFAVLMIAGHNLLDGIPASAFGEAGWVWAFVHAPGMLQPAPGIQVLALYALVPWVGVMAAGYAFAPVVLLDEVARRRAILYTGLAVTTLFVTVRLLNAYGDPQPWSVQDGTLATLLSFINAEKYPPSLVYLSMTLGPALILLALLPAARGPLSRALVTIGRVPFLVYVAHIFLLHAMALVLAAVTLGETAWLFEGMPIISKPQGYGVPLPLVYLLWLLAVAALYPLARWFAALKQRRSDWWLSYL